MKSNVGFADKIIRLIIAGIIIGLYVSGFLKDVLGYLMLVLAVALILTSLFSYCGLYGILGISTSPKKKEE